MNGPQVDERTLELQWSNSQMDQDKHCIGGYVIKLKSKNSAESNSSFYEHHDSTVSYFAVSGGGALWSELPIFVQKLCSIFFFLTECMTLILCSDICHIFRKKNVLI